MPQTKTITITTGCLQHRMFLLQKVNVLVLFDMQCSDGSVYAVRSRIAGRLLERNERLISEPQLLTTKVSKLESDAVFFNLVASQSSSNP
jgi:hypothetical protein